MVLKEELRDKMLFYRRQYQEEQEAQGFPMWNKEVQRVKRFILDSKKFQEAKKVGFYMAKKEEMPITELIKIALKENKEVYLPRVKGKTLVWKRVRDLNDDLEMGYYGVWEPKIHLKELVGIMDVILVPGVAFAPNGKRLGHGAGFYDRYLETCRGSWKIGCCFTYQVSNDIPTLSYDISMDEITFSDNISAEEKQDQIIDNTGAAIVTEPEQRLEKDIEKEYTNG